MLKREIKEILNSMVDGEVVDFFSNDYQGRKTDRVTKTDDGFLVYSWGQGWTDQVASDFIFDQVLRNLWNSKPYGYINQ